MGEYASKKRTQSRGQVNNAPVATEMTNGIPNSVMQDVFAGKRRATSDMMGHREELAPSIAAKMSQAFGMDLGGMQVYRSDAMAGSEMRGMASGNKIVLGSDVDLNTMEGQAILGHEISHIRAQSQGIGTGNSGLLQNAALEHQADAEGMMAARGMSISGESMGMNMGLGMTGVENLTPLSGGMSASAGAPMQAFKPGQGPDDYGLSDTQSYKDEYGIERTRATTQRDIDKAIERSAKKAALKRQEFEESSKNVDYSIIKRDGSVVKEPTEFIPDNYHKSYRHKGVGFHAYNWSKPKGTKKKAIELRGEVETSKLQNEFSDGLYDDDDDIQRIFSAPNPSVLDNEDF